MKGVKIPDTAGRHDRVQSEDVNIPGTGNHRVQSENVNIPGTGNHRRGDHGDRVRREDVILATEHHHRGGHEDRVRREEVIPVTWHCLAKKNG